MLEKNFAIPDTWPDDFFGPHFISIFERLGKFANTEQDVKQIISLINQPLGARILDVPCGFGRFSGYLSQAEFDVTGIDTSNYLLNYAKKYNPGPQYVLSDMRNPPSKYFDVVLNLWTSFGYFDDRNEDKAALTAWYQALKPGGVIVMEISDLERAQVENPGDVESVTYKRREVNEVIEEAWISWPTRLAYTSYSLGEHTIRGKTYIYSRNELVELFQDIGFETIETFGGFDKRVKKPEDRLVLFARKPMGM